MINKVYYPNISFSKHLGSLGFKLVQNGSSGFLYFTHLEKKLQIKINRLSNTITLLNKNGYSIFEKRSIKEDTFLNYLKGEH